MKRPNGCFFPLGLEHRRPSVATANLVSSQNSSGHAWSAGKHEFSCVFVGKLKESLHRVDPDLGMQEVLVNPRCACAVRVYCSRSVCRSVGLSVRTFSLEPRLWWIPNVDMWVCATGARHSKSLERRSQRTVCLWGEA